MPTIARLQAYLRVTARRQYEAVAVAPFTLYFHPSDALPYFNYAIPDEPAGGDLRGPLARLRAEFRARDRLPRFEFLEAYAPELPAALRAHGFTEEYRLHLMVCTPATFRQAPPVAGLTVQALHTDSSAADLTALLTVQRRAFEPDNAAAPTAEAAAPSAADAAAAPTADAITRLRRSLAAGSGAFLARLDGVPVAGGNFTAPADGLTEIAGVATLEPHRRRGIASALTADAVRAAFAAGADLAFLTAADERSGRVYARLGFRAFTTALAYRAE